MAYGKAVLDKTIGSLTLTIRPGCSLTIPANTNVSLGAGGSILGDKTTSIINADQLIVNGAAYLSPDVQKKVTLDKKDIVVTTPNLVYTGKSLGHTDKNSKEEVYTITSPRHTNSSTYIVDETGWKVTYSRGGIEVDEIKENIESHTVIQIPTQITVISLLMLSLVKDSSKAAWLKI